MRNPNTLFTKDFQWTSFIFILLTVTSCGKIKLEQEKEAILSVIEAEMKTSYYGDYESWRKLIAHKPYTFWQTGDHKYSRYWEGWEDLSIRVQKKAASAFFKSKITLIEQDNHQEYELTRAEARFLEKDNGKWKIVYLSGTITR